jgi:uncharacterized protein (TIGR02145 family)
MSKAAINDVISVTKAGYLNYRVVAYNSDTIGIQIKMIVSAGNVTDTDGNVYQTVRIGNQVWMAENLRVTKYNDGSAIPLDTSTVTWNAATPKFCYYGNTTDSGSIKKFGALYNWYVVNPANPKKIAPAGWHAPSDSEWTALEKYLVLNGYNWNGTRDTVQSNKIGKSLAAKTDWYTYPATGAIGNDLTENNSSGFSALPGGSRGFDGYFFFQSHDSNWWSATELGASFAWTRSLSYDGDDLRSYGSYVGSEGSGFYVRLLRDN